MRTLTMSRRLAVNICLGLILGVFAFGLAACSDDTPKPTPKRTLSTSGSGEVSKVPDEAELSAAISAVAHTAKEAMAEISEKGNAMMKAIKKFGIEDKNVQTGSISLVPVYKRRRHGEPVEEPKITGYRASLRYQVASKKIKTFGTLIDALAKAGANNISGIRFYVTEHTVMANEARKKAVEDARQAAQVMAAAAGVKLGPAMTIQDSGGVTVPRKRMMSMSVSASRQVQAERMPVAPGQVSARARVHIVFSIHD